MIEDRAVDRFEAGSDLILSKRYCALVRKHMHLSGRVGWCDIGRRNNFKPERLASGDFQRTLSNRRTFICRLNLAYRQKKNIRLRVKSQPEQVSGNKLFGRGPYDVDEVVAVLVLQRSKGLLGTRQQRRAHAQRVGPT